MLEVITEMDRVIREMDLSMKGKIPEKYNEINDLNKNFVQFYEKNLATIRVLISKNPFACEVFLFLIEKMNNKNAIICPNKVLCETFNKSKKSVERAISHLKNNGYLHVTKAGQTNVYHMNPEIVWKAWDTNKKYCEFEGQILIAKSDNKSPKIKKKNYPIILNK